MHLLIEGGGFSGFWYNYGSLSRLSFDELYGFDTIYAYSSGSLALVLRYASIPLSEIIECVKRIKREMDIEIMKRDSKRTTLSEIIYSMLDELLQDDIHIKLNKSGNINILTSTCWGSEYITHWVSKKDVIDSVIKSSYVPYISGDTFLYKHKYMDGCIMSFLSLFGLRYFGNTKIISTNTGILEQINQVNLSRALELYDEGFKDVLNSNI